MMIRAHRARRIAAAALYGGGGLGLLTAAGYGLLRGEARLARRWIGSPTGQPPAADGVWGNGSGDPIRLAVLGDSSAAGLGVTDAMETPAVLLAVGLSEVAERPVRLVNVAVVGARSADLAGQADAVLPGQPQIVMIMIGANDVTGRVPPAQSVRSLAEAVSRLRTTGAEVVVGTCPDLGTIEPIAQPLRLLARRWSRQMAAAQTVAVVEAGGRTVSLGDILGPEFAARPAEMFSPDRFHPSAAGYAAAAAVMLPSVSAALGLWPEADLPPLPFHREGVAPVATAAARAAGVAGTEVTPTRVDGRERGPRGRWASLRRRRPRLVAPPDGRSWPNADSAEAG
ncbi:MAG TPA: SGNH/GDSL hydrolase family protein [Mycobacteriales bacterium]|nr:SGNH/GDSL hydrolase family protein [Mycobacteriales bacterium]